MSIRASLRPRRREAVAINMLNAAAILLGAGHVAKTIASFLYLALAIALVWRDRELFLQGPRNFIEGRERGTGVA